MVNIGGFFYGLQTEAIKFEILKTFVVVKELSYIVLKSATQLEIRSMRYQIRQKLTLFSLQNGSLAEWLGACLQNLQPQFESERNLKKLQ